jgi:YfiH family protein
MIAGGAKFSGDSLFLPLQKHTNRIHVLRSGIERVIADAVITDRKGVLIGVQVADCVPVLLLDSRRFIAGAVHAGWRGTASGILKKTVEKMGEQFSSSPDDIRVAIGPSIRGCCYEVGDDVASAVEEVTGEGSYHVLRGGRSFIDLSSANMMQAISSGIPGGNIWKAMECTRCSPDRFYSYRHARGATGRQGGFIGMW